MLMAKTRIKLTRDVPANDDGKGFYARKVMVKLGDSWLEANWDTLKRQTIDTMVSGGIRFMVDCELNGGNCYIVTHEADALALRKKYPESPIIYMEQIIGMLAGLPKKVEGFEVVPELLIEYGAEVIGHGKIEEAGREKQAGITFKKGAVDDGVDAIPGVAV